MYVRFTPTAPHKRHHNTGTTPHDVARETARPEEKNPNSRRRTRHTARNNTARRRGQPALSGTRTGGLRGVLKRILGHADTQHLRTESTPLTPETSPHPKGNRRCQGRVRNTHLLTWQSRVQHAGLWPSFSKHDILGFRRSHGGTSPKNCTATPSSYLQVDESGGRGMEGCRRAVGYTENKHGGAGSDRLLQLARLPGRSQRRSHSRVMSSGQQL